MEVYAPSMSGSDAENEQLFVRLATPGLWTGSEDIWGRLFEVMLRVYNVAVLAFGVDGTAHPGWVNDAKGVTDCLCVSRVAYVHDGKPEEHFDPVVFDRCSLRDYGGVMRTTFETKLAERSSSTASAPALVVYSACTNAVGIVLDGKPIAVNAAAAAAAVAAAAAAAPAPAHAQTGDKHNHFWTLDASGVAGIHGDLQ
jgi:hypothetical protein